jgi:hypothetical protein
MALAACTATAPPPPPPNSPVAADAQTLSVQLLQQQGGRLYRIDAEHSTVHIHVFRAGRAAQLGHNHVLSVPRLAGLAWLPGDGTTGAQFELQFRLDEMVLDPPELRAALGPGWASTVSPEMIAATRANMLGDGNLQAAAFPLLRIRSLQIVGELPKLAAQIETELHGVKRTQWLPLRVELDAGRLQAGGALLLRQSDHGITPFSVGAGLLAVRDEVLVEFALRMSAAN